jgi:predicted O-methyltransferase YrrM
MAESDLGTNFPPYLPTFQFVDKFINADHEMLIAKRNGDLINLDIPGWLRPQDALKIYEMAYFSSGEVLELGAYHGLSTSIIARALRNSGNGRSLISLELDAPAALEAQRHTAPWSDIVQIVVGDARESCRHLIEQGRRFGFAFVDHSHTYGLVHAACLDLKSLLVPGGFALFHDYNDERNGADPDYGVWQAVRDGFSDGSFEFWGVYGCTGLWRKLSLWRKLMSWPRHRVNLRGSR